MVAFLADAYRRNPYPTYSALRQFAPVLKVPGRRIWALFDHASVKTALQDHQRFSSRAAPPGGSALDWLLFLDPPRHTQLRSLINRTFTPRAIADLEPRITAMVNDLIDAVSDGGQMDLVGDFSERLPVMVIMEMMGMPSSDAPRVTAWVNAILGLGDTIMGGERGAKARAAYHAATQEMEPYLTALLAARRAEPRDDLITRLAQAELAGEHLSSDEILSFFQLLLLAGTETTTNLIANAMVCLLDHPSQLARVRTDLSLLPAAIEEVLRFRSPVQLVFRTTTEAVTLHGRTIQPHDLVLPVVGSANRDPKYLRDAHRFDIARDPVPHVAFGHGMHYCIGAALSRLEARVALSALLTRLSAVERIDGRAWTPRAGFNVHGPRQLRVRFKAAG